MCQTEPHTQLTLLVNVVWLSPLLPYYWTSPYCTPLHLSLIQGLHVQQTCPNHWTHVSQFTKADDYQPQIPACTITVRSLQAQLRGGSAYDVQCIGSQFSAVQHCKCRGSRLKFRAYVASFAQGMGSSIPKLLF